MSKFFRSELIQDEIMHLIFDDESKGANTLGEGALREFNDLLDELAENDTIKGLIISSGKKDFILGADINEITKFESAEEAKQGAATMQAIFNKIEALSFPSVAAINGQCLGGGLELALACTWRVVCENAKLAFPEIQLGLIPGAGGTQRTPRLVGIQAALDMILTGKRIAAKKAVKIGLADDCVHPAQLLELAKNLATKKRTKKSSSITAKNFSKELPRLATEGNPLGRRVVEKKAREMIEKNTKGFYPAPYKALTAIIDGYDRKLEKGLELEAKLFGELSQTKESKSLIHLFHATTHGKKNPCEEALKESFAGENLQQIGVIGSGFMGAGIATVNASKGLRVLLSDPNPDSTTRALKSSFKFFDKKRQRGRMKDFEVEKAMGLISPGLNTQGFQRADVVIEAVFEDLALKQKILAEIETKAPEKQVFASNTSALPISDIAEHAKFPERVLGMHFFSPVEKMPLLEIVTTEKTADWATARAFELGQKMGKQTIVVKDSPGFYTTRALAFFLAEAALILESGTKIEDIDHALTSFGFPVGPITLMDEVGIDVGSHVLETMKKAFSDRIEVPDGLEEVKASGRLGRKNAQGFYEYVNGKKVGPDESIYELIADWKENTLSEDEIVDRCALVFINESARCLEEGILACAYDGDVGAVFGLGFPPFWGGPFRYVDHLGAKVIVDRLEALADKYGSRFAPADILKTHAENSTRFFPEEN